MPKGLLQTEQLPFLSLNLVKVECRTLNYLSTGLDMSDPCLAIHRFRNLMGKQTLLPLRFNGPIGSKWDLKGLENFKMPTTFQGVPSGSSMMCNCTVRTTKSTINIYYEVLHIMGLIRDLVYDKQRSGSRFALTLTLVRASTSSRESAVV